MKYTSQDHRQYVTLNLSFVDEPITLISTHSLPLKQATMMGDPTRADLALEEILPEGFNRILLTMASQAQCEEFYTKWSEASEKGKPNADFEGLMRRMLGDSLTQHPPYD